MNLTLTVPPSTNNRMYKNMRLTKEYRQWKDRASDVIASQLDREADDDRYHVAIWIYWGDRRRRDLDNYIKGPLDAITESFSVWKDDSQIDRITIERKEGHRDEVQMEEGTMEILITPYSVEAPF